MTETERALRAALPGLEWEADGEEWEALVFGQSYAQLIPVGRLFYVKVLGNAETCYSLPEAVQWLRAHVVAVHVRLGVALEGVK
jgi:hypothetical protein